MKIKIINFQMQTKQKEKLKEHIKEIFFMEEKKARQVFFNCVDKEKIFALNKTHLEHAWETDVIAFEYEEKGQIDGEVFICKEVVEENAKKHNTDNKEELSRAFFHATLHLCGYSDKTKKQKKTMTEKEDFYLKRFHVKQKQQENV